MKTLLGIATIIAMSLAAQAEVFKVIQPGKKPASNLKIKSSKVPTYEWSKSSKEIPRLNIGEETELEAAVSPLQIPPVPMNQIKPVVKAKPISVSTFDRKKFQMTSVTPFKSLANAKTLSQIPEVKALKQTYEPTYNEPSTNVKEMVLFKSQEFKILEGQIYYEILKNYEMALAHFSEILNDKDFAIEATYHYSLAAGELALPTEFRTGMLKVAKTAKEKELQIDATKALVDKVEILSIQDIKEVDSLVEKLEIDISKNDVYNFFRAKYYLEQGQLGEVEASLQEIGLKSKYYNESLLISGLSSYRQAKIDPAAQALSEVLQKTSKDSPIRTVAAITLARIYFQKGKYKEAFNAYLEVDKAHPLWLQAMVEQAWTQILLKDYEGAAGNMFSLHTDFFKNAYNPESYVVRTVGYLNLCQFGDGMSVLNNLGHRYAPMVGKLEKFYSSNKDPKPYYELIRGWFKNSDLKEIEGVPRSFIAQMARNPSFVVIQKQINNYEDEVTAFNNVTLKLVQREKDLLKKQTEATSELAKIQAKMHESKEKAGSLKSDEAYQQKRIASYKYQFQTVNKARNNVKEVREKAIVRIDKEKAGFREKAAQAIKKEYVAKLSELKHLLDQNELLQYEIYSGAGEHIRYQASGGNTPNRETASEAPQREKDKISKWNFNGEIWEDEIGHFRSSLKNVCPEDGSPQAKK